MNIKQNDTLNLYVFTRRRDAYINIEQADNLTNLYV